MNELHHTGATSMKVTMKRPIEATLQRAFEPGFQNPSPGMKSAFLLLSKDNFDGFHPSKDPRHRSHERALIVHLTQMQL